MNSSVSPNFPEERLTIGLEVIRGKENVSRADLQSAIGFFHQWAAAAR
ncbi:hypothetical protein [Antarcticimicrobium luteum]|nr:hypothetical protein [Antarcticimicrobium luteum]